MCVFCVVASKERRWGLEKRKAGKLLASIFFFLFWRFPGWELNPDHSIESAEA